MTYMCVYIYTHALHTYVFLTQVKTDEDYIENFKKLPSIKFRPNLT